MTTPSGKGVDPTATAITTRQASKQSPGRSQTVSRSAICREPYRMAFAIFSIASMFAGPGVSSS